MGYVSTGVGDPFSALLVSLMALCLAQVDQNSLFVYNGASVPLIIVSITSDFSQISRKL